MNGTTIDDCTAILIVGLWVMVFLIVLYIKKDHLRNEYK